MDRLQTAHGDVALSAKDRARLERRLADALRRARRHGEALAAITVAVDPATDPTAVVAASRRHGEPWFCFEQPDRDGAALAALGAAVEIEAAGPDRFKLVAARWRVLASQAACDPPDGPRGCGPIAVGGFAFAPTGGQSPPWAGYAAASLHVPEVALVRRGTDVRLTLCVLATPDDTVADLLARVDRRAAELRVGVGLPLLDPDPAGRYRVVSAMPPEHYEQAVAGAVQRIKAGALQKVVLAREVQVHAPVDHDPAAVLGVLRQAFPSCHLVCAGRGDAAFVAASPELLIRREGERAATLALAGSTRRSADPAVDDHLGERLMRSAKDREEQAIVIRRIARALKPHAVWVTAPDEPEVVKMANIQHLGTPIRAQLAHAVSAVELAGLLHPTPAVGGEPLSVAAPLIPALEGLDRGWYAGPVGWTDLDEDGEFVVALRCALLRGPVARCYAGVGVVRDSDPAAELAETEVKLQALLPVLAG
ncbi:MAG: menaquinone-specific isochorismate synthase [Baekduia sp.]|jgi:salicylate biosynthesis isochorismate synthase/menaquinone-specific isochorismate synthase|nr:menaquinone-specific isochorismate synthase [Baekduia sp.]